MNALRPRLSVVIPTHDNLSVLRRCLESWQTFASGKPVELVVVEDGCRDLTPQYLDDLSNSEWGQQHLRWIHETDLHELRCTNRGLKAAHADLLMAWQDDMFLCRAWLVDELIETFAAYSELGLLCLSRGLNCLPFDGPINAWEDLIDGRRLQSTIGPAPFNWFRLEEVDAVIRPWAVRRACLETVGYLDEAFVPTEWDEADLCFRIRRAGWKIAAHGYERVRAYSHLGSSTLARALSDRYVQRVLENGRLFHQRWDDAIRSDAGRERHRWWRRSSVTGWLSTATEACLAIRRLVSP